MFIETSTQRPKEVEYFEILQFTVLFIGVVLSAMMYTSSIQLASPFYVLFLQFVTLLFLLWLIVMISRKRSNKAKWAYVILFAVGLPFSIPQLSNMLDNGIQGYISIFQLALTCISIYFLFTPNFKEYLTTKNN